MSVLDACEALTYHAAFAPYSINPFGLVNLWIYMSDPAFADIDRDGDLDAFIGNSDGNTVFFENTGSSPAAQPRPRPGGLPYARPDDPARPRDRRPHRRVVIGFYLRDVPYMRPRSIDFEAELHRLPTGKLYKRLLKDHY